VSRAYSNRPTSLSEIEFDSIRVLVEAELGVQLPPEKRPMLQARLARRCRELGFERAHDYCDYLFGHGKEKGETTHLLDLVTTNFTYFYREPQQLGVIEEEMLPPLLDACASPARPFLAWSAACATGEEPWTLAMMCDAAALGRSTRPRIQIFASDVSTRALQAAAQAIYPSSALEHVREPWRQRYFLRSRDAHHARVRVTPALRQAVTFRHINLMGARYDVPGALDLILLRNVLIYFDSATRAAVVSHVADHLRPGGLLAIGMSESLAGLDLPLEHVCRSIYRKAA
jgi:chemotaxis protein methyltransferase CheR